MSLPRLVPRLFSGVPLLALVLLAPAWFARGPAERTSAPAPAAGEAQAAACGVHGCGCPHGDVVTSCCCAGGTVPRRATSAPRLRFDPPPATSVAATKSDGPASTLESFHCSGGKRERAAPSSRVAPATESQRHEGIVSAVERRFGAKNEPGPLFDLRSEPRTPPPRRASRA